MLDDAIGILGSCIDPVGSGWRGEPWFLLFPEGDGNDSLPEAITPYSDDRAEQLAELAGDLQRLLPSACVMLKRVSVRGADGDAVGPLAVLLALDDAGQERVAACRAEPFDDGRDGLERVEHIDLGVMPGVIDSFIRNALSLARAVRTGAEPADTTRWRRLTSASQDALRR